MAFCLLFFFVFFGLRSLFFLFFCIFFVPKKTSYAGQKKKATKKNQKKKTTKKKRRSKNEIGRKTHTFAIYPSYENSNARYNNIDWLNLLQKYLKTKHYSFYFRIIFLFIDGEKEKLEESMSDTLTIEALHLRRREILRNNLVPLFEEFPATQLRFLKRLEVFKKALDF